MTMRSDSGSASLNRKGLREQAAVLAWFDDSWLELPGTAAEGEVEVSDFLMEECRRVPGPDGEPHWALTDLIRRRTLRDLGAEGAWRHLRASKQMPKDDVQAALFRHLSSDISETRSPNMTSTSIVAELQAVHWLAGVVPGLPNVATLEAERHRQELVSPLRSLTERGFFGRERELARMADHLRDDHGLPLVISGVGGVGKSTLIAKFVTDAIDQTTGLVFAYLNFDRGALAADKPAQLFAEILRQVILQSPADHKLVAPLIEDLLYQERYDVQGLGRSSQTAASTVVTDISRGLFSQAALVLKGACPRGLLVVLDTFEEVQRQRITDIFVLWQFLRELRRLVPLTRVVISGRALDAGFGADFQSDVVELDELDEDAAMHLLMQEPGVHASRELARRTIDLVSRNPLSLRLAIQVLRKSNHDDPLLDLELQEGQIQGQLYRRILKHIDDPDVREIAHPGLVVRVVTPGVIRHVLARPCGIAVPDDRTAVRLYYELEREATLVQSAGQALSHRSDVRKLMLPSLEREAKTRVAQIHRAAVRYYRSQSGTAARAEEIYHRLMLEQSVRTLNKYWDPAALQSLLSSIDELPPSSQVFLWSHSGGQVTLDEQVVRVADDRSWARATEPMVVAELRAGLLQSALRLVMERRGLDGESLLPQVEVEALEAIREFDRALDILRTARGAALRQRRSADAVALTLDVLRILERMGRFDEAVHEARELREALRAGQGESALDYLIVTTSYLRLLRRNGEEGSDAYRAAVADAVEMAERRPRRELISRPGLLRELLAEIGDASIQLLRFGIDTVGVARGASDRLDGELDRVDESLREPGLDATGDTTEDAHEPDDEQRFEARGRTGQKVKQYADETGLGDGLRAAIRESYQAETDILYS
jgi:hypothetical protein